MYKLSSKRCKLRGFEMYFFPKREATAPPENNLVYRLSISNTTLVHIGDQKRARLRPHSIMIESARPVKIWSGNLQQCYMFLSW